LDVNAFLEQLENSKMGVNSAVMESPRWGDDIGMDGSTGAENDGMGTAFYDINGNGIQDIVVFYIDNPSGTNRGYYKIGWDLSDSGQVRGWTDTFPVNGWFGHDAEGAGVTVGDIDRNGSPDILFYHVDDPSGANYGKYAIGWDVNSKGKIQRTTKHSVPGSLGNATDGAGVALADINGNGILDLVTFIVDNPNGANRGYYRIGWDLATSGSTKGETQVWGSNQSVKMWFGHRSQGAGLDVMDIDGNGKQDIIFYHMDAPSGRNNGVYAIGWDMDAYGKIDKMDDTTDISFGLAMKRKVLGLRYGH
jgi:hypothetical protein